MTILLRLDRLARMSPFWLTPGLHDQRRRACLTIALSALVLLLLIGAGLVLALR